MHCAGLCCVSFYHSKSRRARNEARNEQVWRNERTNVFVFLHALPSLSDVLPNHDVSSIKFNVPRSWNFYSRPESLWQVLSLHLQIIFTLKPDAAVFAHWSCKIGVQDFYGRSSYFREVWKGPAQSSLYWTPPIWSCHWPQGFSRHLFFASAEASRPARLLLFTVILAMIRDLTVFTYLKEE